MGVVGLFKGDVDEEGEEMEEDEEVVGAEE